MRASGIVLAALTAMATLGVANAAASTETIVFVRHGEKPDQGLGQLSCKGLNRALALPSALARFGRPTAIFAPDPADKKADLGTRYSYVRPLATIEPTAIRLGMPVDTTFGISTTDRLLERLWQGEFADSTVFVAWEHRQIEAMAKALVASHFGDVAVVPEWNGDDFDSVYIVRIDRPAVTCGSNGGSAAPCPSPVSVNGACGSSPHTCFAGYPIGFNDNGAMATWTCGGGNGGASASCSAAAPVNAACGGSPDSCSPGSPSGRNDSGTTGTRVGAPRVSFEKASEGLNGLSDACPAVGGRRSRAVTEPTCNGPKIARKGQPLDAALVARRSAQELEPTGSVIIKDHGRPGESSRPADRLEPDGGADDETNGRSRLTSKSRDSRSWVILNLRHIDAPRGLL